MEIIIKGNPAEIAELVKIAKSDTVYDIEKRKTDITAEIKKQLDNMFDPNEISETINKDLSEFFSSFGRKATDERG